MKKAKLWAHATYEMVEHGDFSKRLNLPAYVRAENYDFIYQRCENMEAENARLKAEVDRLKLDYYENKTGEVSATVVQTFNTETGEADYVVSLDDYKKMADMFNAEFLRLKAEVERLAMAGSQSIAVGDKLREMVGDHHWSLEFDRVRTDWYHASRGVLSRLQNPNTPPTAV